MTRLDDDTQLIAYVYDELPPLEREAFEARLAAEPALRAEAEGLLATRSLLGADARFGEQSGLDEPPPHLRNAILQAEQLARPREIRAAAASAAPQGLLLRLSSWWVGAGLAASAAAAVLLLVKDTPEAPGLDAAPAPLAKTVAAEAPAQEVAPPAPAPALEPQGPRQGAAAKDDEKEELAASAEQPAPAALEGAAARSAGALAGQPLGGSGSGFGGGGVGGLGAAPRNDVALGVAGASGDPDFADPHAAEAATAVPSGAAPKERVEASSLAEEEARSADEAAPAQGALAEQKASRGGFPPAAPVTSAPAASAPARLPGPPPLPAAVKAELARGRAAAKKRDESRRKQKGADKPAAEPGDFAGSLAGQLEQGLLAGAQELAAGRPTEALEIFQGVVARDPRGVFVGVAAYVGQMRALVALKRPREALALLPLVKRPGAKAPGVSEGVKVAAEAAEQLGDLALAVSLYRELQRDPVHRSDAERALARLQGQRQGAAPAAAADLP